jgi:Domain of unknown function (DUF4349)
MRSRSSLVLCFVLGLAACGPAPQQVSPDNGVPPPVPGYVGDGIANPASKTPEQAAAKLAYSHQLDLEMPPAMVGPRFGRARDACVNNPAYGCLLLSADLRSGNGYPRAGLTVRLPHGQVEAFEQSVLAPLPGETAGETAILSRSTSAEDLTQALQDTERRLSELTQYRDRLMELAKRSDAKVEDLIKVESELASTQSQIEAIIAQQKHLNDEVATEKLTIDLTARQSIAAAENPIVRVWHDSAGILSENVADALRAIIATLPWLVPLVLLIQILRLLWRFMRRRK